MFLDMLKVQMKGCAALWLFHIFCQNPRQIFMKETIFHKATSLEHVSLLWNEHLP